MLSTVVNITSIISSLGVIVGLILAILQLKKSTSVAIADHSRRRKEATIDYYDKIRDKTAPWSRVIRKISNDDPVTIEQLEEDEDLMIAVSKYLSLMERLAVGIYSDVFDYEVYRELYKTYTIKRYYQFKAYIDDTRKKPPQSSRYFIYFERLVKRLEDDSSTDLPVIKTP